MKKLIWSRLKNMKCPKCNLDLMTSNRGTRMIGCENEESCGFILRGDKFDELVKEMYTKPKVPIAYEEDNLSRLNNL